MSRASHYGVRAGPQAGARSARAKTSTTIRTESKQPVGLSAILPAGRGESDPSNVKWKLRELEADYRRDVNSVHAFEAFAIARRARIDPPEWSLIFLDGAADRIFEIRDEVAAGVPVKREAECVGRALGFGVDGPGRGGRFMHATMLERDRAIYFEVGREINAGTKLYLAYYAVAKAMNISPSTVCRAYLRITKRNSNAVTQDDAKCDVRKRRNL